METVTSALAQEINAKALQLRESKKFAAIATLATTYKLDPRAAIEFIRGESEHFIVPQTCEDEWSEVAPGTPGYSIPLEWQSDAEGNIASAAVQPVTKGQCALERDISAAMYARCESELAEVQTVNVEIADAAHDEPEETASVPADAIEKTPATILTDGKAQYSIVKAAVTKNLAYIAGFFNSTKDENARGAFLKKAVGTVFTELTLNEADDPALINRRVGYVGTEDGLFMWEGTYPSRTIELELAWASLSYVCDAIVTASEGITPKNPDEMRVNAAAYATETDETDDEPIAEGEPEDEPCGDTTDSGEEPDEEGENMDDSEGRTDSAKEEPPADVKQEAAPEPGKEPTPYEKYMAKYEKEKADEIPFEAMTPVDNPGTIGIKVLDDMLSAYAKVKEEVMAEKHTSVGARLIGMALHDERLEKIKYGEVFPTYQIARHLQNRCDADAEFNMLVCDPDHTFLDLIENFLVPSLEEYCRTNRCYQLSDDMTYEMAEMYYRTSYEAIKAFREQKAAYTKYDEARKKHEYKQKQEAEKKEQAAKKRAEKKGKGKGKSKATPKPTPAPSDAATQSPAVKQQAETKEQTVETPKAADVQLSLF